MQDLLVGRARRAAHAARDDDVQADVARLRQQVQQIHQRVTRRCCHQVIIVHQDPQLGTRPPVSVANLFRRHIRTRQTRAHELRDLTHLLHRILMIRYVAQRVLFRDRAQQGTAHVDRHDLCLARRVQARDLRNDRAKERRLARLRIPEEIQVRVRARVEQERPQA